MADKNTHIIIIHETARQSWARDAGSYFTALALMLPGWWIGSGWLSALGFILFWAALLGKVFASAAQNRYTPEQARERIDAIIATRPTGDA